MLVEFVEFQLLDVAFEARCRQVPPGRPNLFHHKAVQLREEGQHRCGDYLGRVSFAQRGGYEI